jgi:esterase/lipase superfamily enzyme
LYYDFGDVLVPRQMKVDKNASFVFRTPGLSAGVLSLKGRLDGHSLIAFFENNMANDNWRLVSAFKSFRNIMLFKKESRWCVINITEKQIYTYLEIWVSPTVEGAVPNLIQ